MKERIKSVVLVSLIVMSVVLSRWVLLDSQGLRHAIGGEGDVITQNISSYINPQSYFVSFGGMSYTKVYDQELRKRIWGNIQAYSLSTLASFEKYEIISERDYVGAFSTRSILLKMPLELRLETMLDFYGVRSVDDNIKNIIASEYLVVAGEKSSLYIKDAGEGIYYKFTGKTENEGLQELIADIKGRGYIEYRKVSDRFSLESTVTEAHNYLNYTLIPYQYDYLVSNLSIRNEVDLDSDRFEEQIRAVARSVFGNRFDFVKRLEDINGSIIYMYGYGDKALTVEKSGVISYRQKFEPSKSENLSVKQAFEIGCGQLERFGAIPDGLNWNGYNRSEESGIVKHTFYFEYKLGNYEVTPQPSRNSDIVVEVTGNQLTRIQKNVKVYMGDASLEKTLQYDRMYDIDECITTNFMKVSIYYLQDNNIYDASMNSIQYYFSIRSAISRIEMNYYQLEEEHMIPVWVVDISGRIYIFDAYSGEIITTYRRR